MATPLRLAGVIRESVVDGPGWRFVVFSQGCKHNCEGCHNPETHDMNGGYESSAERIITEVKKDKLLKGITLSGGDPFEQAENFSVLAKMVHDEGLDVVTYTGYTFEQLYKGMAKNEGWRHLLEQTDILIDGKFELSKKSLNCKFRGSTNQRILDAKKSLKEGIAIEIEI